MGEDLLRYSNKMESSDPRQCFYDHQLTNKAYLSGITVRNIYESLTHKMAAKTSWHGYGTKLRHCNPMYRNFACSLALLSRYAVTEATKYTFRLLAPHTFSGHL